MKNIPLPPSARRHLKAQPLLDKMCHDLNTRTQTDVAADLGISKSMMSELVAGKRGVGPKLIAALSRVYGKASERDLPADERRGICQAVR